MNSGRALSSFFKRKANLPAVVVLPAPWRPTIMITVGIWADLLSGTASSPINSVNSSLTILTICWAGFNPLRTSAPAAFSRTFLTKFFTTAKLTSASNNASRISRIVSRRSASVTLGFRRSFSIAFWRRSVNPSNAIFYSSSKFSKRPTRLFNCRSFG